MSIARCTLQAVIAAQKHALWNLGGQGNGENGEGGGGGGKQAAT